MWVGANIYVINFVLFYLSKKKNFCVILSQGCPVYFRDTEESFRHLILLRVVSNNHSVVFLLQFQNNLFSFTLPISHNFTLGVIKLHLQGPRSLEEIFVVQNSFLNMGMTRFLNFFLVNDALILLQVFVELLLVLCDLLLQSYFLILILVVFFFKKNHVVTFLMIFCSFLLAS